MAEKAKETVYELGYLLKNDLDNKAVLAQLEKFSAEIVHSSDPKAIKLAYEIDKQESAQFAYLHFKIEDQTSIDSLSKALTMEDDVLRFIIIKLPSKKEVAKKKSAKPAKEKKEGAFASLSNEKLEEKLEEFVS